MILQIIIVLGRQGINSFVHDPNKIISITYFFPLRAFIYVITQKLKIAIKIGTSNKCKATYFSIVIRASYT